MNYLLTNHKSCLFQKRPTPSAELESSQNLKKSQSTFNVDKNSQNTQDLLGLFSADINFDSGPGDGNNEAKGPELPGAESTRYQ